MEEFIPDPLGIVRRRSKRDDRRAHPRLDCKGVAEIHILPLERRLPGTLIDLSVAGCCIEANASLPPMANLRVEVHLNVNGDVLRVAGIVRNLRNSRRAGIEFTGVTPRKAEQIEELVKELVERVASTRSGLTPRR